MILNRANLPHIRNIPEFFMVPSKSTKEFKWAFDPLVLKKITSKQAQLVLWKQVAIKTSLFCVGIIPISIVLDVGYNLLRWSFGYLIVRYHNHKVKKLPTVERIDKTKVAIANAIVIAAGFVINSRNIQPQLPKQPLQIEQLSDVAIPPLNRMSVTALSFLNIFNFAAIFSLGAAIAVFVDNLSSRIRRPIDNEPLVERQVVPIRLPYQRIVRRNNNLLIGNILEQLQNVQGQARLSNKWLDPRVLPELERLRENLQRIANPINGIRINPNDALVVIEMGQNRETITLNNLPEFLAEFQFRLSAQATHNIFRKNGYKPTLNHKLQPMQLAIEDHDEQHSLESETVFINKNISLDDFIGLTTSKSQPMLNKISAVARYLSCCVFGNGQVPLNGELYSSVRELQLAKDTLVLTDDEEMQDDDKCVRISTKEIHICAITRTVEGNKVDLLKLMKDLRTNQQLSQNQITFLLPKMVERRDDVIIDNSLLFSGTINIRDIKINRNTKYILLPIGIKGIVENHVVLAIIDLEKKRMEYVDRKGIAPGNRKNHHFMIGGDTIPKVLHRLCKEFDLNEFSFTTSERQKDHFNCAPLMLDRAKNIGEDLDSYLSRPINTHDIRSGLIQLIQEDIRTYKPTDEDLKGEVEVDVDDLVADDSSDDDM